jgi:hypothetical protein
VAAAHTHLDRAVRSRGTCPGCDVFWDAQDARLAERSKTIGVERQLEQMIDRRQPQKARFCRAMVDDGSGTHVCNRRQGHPDPHFCGTCNLEWVAKRKATK